MVSLGYLQGLLVCLDVRVPIVSVHCKFVAAGHSSLLPSPAHHVSEYALWLMASLIRSVL